MHSSTKTISLHTKKDLQKALKSFLLVRNFSHSELETLEILANEHDSETISKSIQESQKNKVRPIEDIL